MNGMRRSVYLPAELVEASGLRGQSLGYKSWAGYIAGLIRADIATNQSHALSLKVASMGGASRDVIDREILSKCRQADSVITLDQEDLERDKVIEFVQGTEKPLKRKGGAL